MRRTVLSLMRDDLLAEEDLRLISCVSLGDMVGRLVSDPFDCNLAEVEE